MRRGCCVADRAADTIAVTERLILREWRRSDRAPYRTALNTPRVTAYLGGPVSARQSDAGIARIRAAQAASGYSFWAVERRSDGAFLGYCGPKLVRDPSVSVGGEVEIGWRLREDAWGQGYAREAAAAAMAWAWANLAVSRVVAMTVPANAASWGLMIRLGMTPRPDLDFDHPMFTPDHPLSRHVVYAIDRPRG